MVILLALYKLGIFTHKNSNHTQVYMLYVLNIKKIDYYCWKLYSIFFLPVENKPPFSWISTYKLTYNRVVGNYEACIELRLEIYILNTRCNVQTFNLDWEFKVRTVFCKVDCFLIISYYSINYVCTVEICSIIWRVRSRLISYHSFFFSLIIRPYPAHDVTI